VGMDKVCQEEGGTSCGSHARSCRRRGKLLMSHVGPQSLLQWSVLRTHLCCGVLLLVGQEEENQKGQVIHSATFVIFFLKLCFLCRKKNRKRCSNYFYF